MSTSIRDASLTTLLRRQRTLAAWRTNNKYPYSGPLNSASNSLIVPEQSNTQTGDVPTDAKIGACVGCTSTANFTNQGYSQQYGFQSPANVRSSKY